MHVRHFVFVISGKYTFSTLSNYRGFMATIVRTPSGTYCSGQVISDKTISSFFAISRY